MKATLFLADGFEEIEAITVVDVLRRSKIEIETVSVTGKKEVTGAHRIIVLSDLLYEQVDFTDVDMLILPGGQPGTKNLSLHKPLRDKLVQFSSQEKWIAAICAAPSILGELGLLRGITAVSFPGYEHLLEGAIIDPKNSVVVDGNFITSRGPGTALQFALEIVTVLKNISVSNSVKEEMIISS